jgi:Ca2+-binding RTX toxin-like protein
MGGAGYDTIDGGAGIDIAAFSGALAAYTIVNNAGTLTISGPDGTDTVTNVEKLSFSDQIIDAPGVMTGQTLTGTTGNDFLAGGPGDDTLSGLGGDDVLQGGAGNDTMDGGPGTDNAFYDNATSGVTVSLAISGPQNTGGAGTDTLSNIENLYGSPFGDTFTGDGGANSILGNGGNDVLSGGAGNDYLSGGPGNDTIDGGAGIDTAAFSGPLASYTIVNNAGTLTITGPDGSDTVTNVEKLSFSDQTINAPGAVTPGQTLTGTSGNDVLTGGSGDDNISGLGGDDVLTGGAGNDTIDGGTGTDNAYYDTATSGVTVNLNLQGSPQDTHGAGVDTLISIENVTGSPFGDTLTGDAGNNQLLGMGGNDIINGGAGSDYIDGGAGNDTIDGGPGNDTVSYVTSTTGVQMNLAVVGPMDTGSQGVDTLTNIENVTGSYNNDSLTGDANNNVLSGIDGNDILEGGPGDDVLDGGPGIDNASYMYTPSAVHVDLSISGQQDTIGAGKDTLISIENLIGSAFGDTLLGDGNANTIQGLAGNDTLSGGGGDDVLLGGAGADNLTGGAGNDTFLYFALSDSTQAAPDLITDFTTGDKINLLPISPNFQIGDGTHTGDIVIHAFDGVNNRTVVDIYSAPNTIGGEIWLTGDHSGMSAADFVL